ncbi:hypothetical protein [Mesorhizobium sp.]|uniref:hypothetical protein n=1 Tax=Mesorhizobium sp. TaxID=1871066 RepID=UPI000FE5F7E5|nr:hypothetical protein [Mesorhizobium sp.]RWM06971.1 MAG: hypothetical protein EOR71_17990 [Mesorhizobium sp.]RWM29384.1 MAG: hypothetical protein EOR74_06810 [Mesorhizobium sp.]TIO53882.1 MAG: hypothetical protein E5X78_05855 [Mesorhizobium sp.]TIO61509.1 MAG: hypothetical protein E5X79_07000 [Mesorhizobium sp.]TJV65895.1 MAG: hypothetical protein E5X80_08315 [Mesorhizobium sp.]
MAKAQTRDSISAFDCDVIRAAFRAWVIEDNIPEIQWRECAERLVRTMTGIEDVDPDMLDWIVQK